MTAYGLTVFIRSLKSGTKLKTAPAIAYLRPTPSAYELLDRTGIDSGISARVQASFSMVKKMRSKPERSSVSVGQNER